MLLLKKGNPILGNLKDNLNSWFLAVRPKTLAASICPVVIGSVLAYKEGYFAWIWLALSVSAALLVQIGTNLANDYYDFKKGADTAARIGPIRVTQSGLIAPHRVKFAFILCFVLAFLMALYLAYRGGWPIIVIGVLSILFGYLYTGGPYPLAYSGLGDITAFVFFGPVAVAGTYYVHVLSWSFESVLIGMAPGLFSMGILAVNNLRDVIGDAIANKRTLAVRFGVKFVRLEYVFSIAAAVFLGMSRVSVWMGAVFIPALPIIKVVLNCDGEILNKALADTGRLLVIYTILFTAITCLM
ncbi:MAG: 1,4-dihydroxy-2-naphthoate polyprenyltransferase [Candidatus Margulisbacteria bacterium]|nr:1,4-dihydroxy-2-naphthoate polyprenyltransferase [Candidatus Margulisiibacteriota bacterium]